MKFNPFKNPVQAALVLCFILIFYLWIKPENDEPLPDSGIVQNRIADASRNLPDTLPPEAPRLTFIDQAYQNDKASRPRLDPSPSAEEIKRLRNWKANFPFPPITDPNLKYSHEDYISDPPNRRIAPVKIGIMDDHESLKRFYADDLRYSKEFESMYHILAESGRTNNVIPMIQMFWNLWKYHNHIDTDEEYAMKHKESVFSILRDSGGWMIPNLRTKEREPEDRMIQEQLINATSGLADLPEPWPMTAEERAHGKSYAQSFREGNAENIGDILVPYVGHAEELQQFVKNKYSMSLEKQMRSSLEPPGMPPNVRVSSIKYSVRLSDGTRIELDKDDYVNWVLNDVIPIIDEANSETQEIDNQSLE